MKYLIYALFFPFLTGACTSVDTINNRRIKVIKEAVSAIARYDTSTIYKLMDATYAFDIDGKDGILYKINYAYNKFKVYDPEAIESKIHINEKPVHSKEYRFSCCRTESIKSDSFDLLFTFSDYVNDSKIKLIDIDVYKKNASPTLAP